MNDSGRQQSGGLGSALTIWLGVISTVVTLGLTALNAYWSREISATDQRLKLKASELEEKKLELEKLNFSLTEGKERMNRYAFVQGLFAQVLNDKDMGQKTLAVNLINLALTADEAKTLFAGLQTSPDKQAREVGNLGADLVGVINLVTQIDAATKESRIGAVDTLIKNYRADARAVDQVLRLLEPPKLNSLSASGRVNVLVFLRNTERAAWSPELLARADRAIALIRARHESKEAEIGEQTKDGLDQLARHLATLRG
ncbi:MAG: hypothetical protein QM702_22360 [Rubrivivax sp.]